MSSVLDVRELAAKQSAMAKDHRRDFASAISRKPMPSA